MTNDFDGRTILITGGASGIGLALAQHLAGQGARRLVLVDRNEEALGRATLPCEVERVAGDVADEALWDGLAPKLAELDHVAVNAGVAFAAPIAEHDFADWRRVLSVNLDGAFLTMRAAMRALKARGKGGSIVVTSSAAGVKAEPGVGAYGASKAALIHLVKVAAKEGAPDRIRVNALAPAGVQTPVWDAMPFFADLVQTTGSRDEAFKQMAKLATPLGRYATAEEVAAQLAFLLSDACSLVTGATLVSDGGYTL